MKHFNWKKAYDTGIVEIDKQHRHFFEIANTFYDELFSETTVPDNKKIFKILENLKDFSEFHCKYEKKIYPTEIVQEFFNFENMLAERIEELRDLYKSNNIIVLYGFAEFLRKWLSKHILILNNKNFKELLKKETLNLAYN